MILLVESSYGFCNDTPPPPRTAVHVEQASPVKNFNMNEKNGYFSENSHYLRYEKTLRTIKNLFSKVASTIAPIL